MHPSPTPRSPEPPHRSRARHPAALAAAGSPWCSGGSETGPQGCRVGVQSHTPASADLQLRPPMAMTHVHSSPGSWWRRSWELHPPAGLGRPHTKLFTQALSLSSTLSRFTNPQQQQRCAASTRPAHHLRGARTVPTVHRLAKFSPSMSTCSNSALFLSYYAAAHSFMCRPPKQ